MQNVANFTHLNMAPMTDYLSYFMKKSTTSKSTKLYTTTNHHSHHHDDPTNKTETQLVEISSRVQILESGDLLISNVRESDAGLYTCVRSNEAGTVNGEAYLGVLGKYLLYIYIIFIVLS